MFALRCADRLDALEQLAGFLGRQHGRLAFSDDVFGAAHGVGGVYLQNVAGHEPVKEHAQRGQVLLDGGRGARSLQVLDEGGDVEGLNVGEPGDAAALAPGVKTPRGTQVGPARVGVVDPGGEKLQDAPGGLGGVGVNRDAGGSGLAGERMSPVPAVIFCPSKPVSLIRRGLPLGVILECDKGSYHTLSHCNRKTQTFFTPGTPDRATRGSDIGAQQLISVYDKYAK